MTLGCAAAGKPAPLVAVDVGHTLAAPGAISARGVGEFDFNRALAARVVEALHQRGLRAELINADGLIPSLPARAEAAAALGADLLVSVHHDSVNADELEYWQWQDSLQSYNDQWAGHSLFVSRRNPQPDISLACARRMGAYLQQQGFTPTDKNARKRAWADASTTVHWFDDLIVLYRARMPAVLFEAGVIKHRDEELLLADPLRQTHMAHTLAEAIDDCLRHPARGLPSLQTNSGSDSSATPKRADTAS